MQFYDRIPPNVNEAVSFEEYDWSFVTNAVLSLVESDKTAFPISIYARSWSTAMFSVGVSSSSHLNI